MFSLIVSIISIALVAVLAAASIYYGGDAFTKGSAKALASTVVTQAQQISSANTLFKNESGGVSALNVDELVTDSFLASAPAMPSKVGDANLEVADIDAVEAGHQSGVVAVIDNDEVCALINEQANGTTAYVATAQFGCATVGAAGTALNGVGGAAENDTLFVYKG